MSSYISLLRTRGVTRTMTSQLVARFPSGMVPLGLLIHIQTIFYSYGAAGLVLGATSIGQATAGPVTARMMGRFGARRVLILTTLLCAAALTTAALARMPLWGYMVAGAVSGLSFPPVQPAVRTIYPKLVAPSQLARLFSLDASAQEIIWVAGPLVITVVAREISPVLGLLVCVAFLVGGGAWFIASPELGRVDITRSASRFGAVLLNPGVLLATVAGLLLIGSAAATETGVVARFGEGGAQAGIVLALSAVASLMGGLTLGHLPIRGLTLARRLAIAAVGGVLLTFATGVASTSGAMMVYGLSFAPVLAVLYTMVAVSVDISDSVEAYGWLGTGQLVGAAIGSAIAGARIDAVGPDGGFVVGAAIAVVAVLVAVAFRRAQPHMAAGDHLHEGG